MITRPLTPEDALAYVALRREMLGDAPWAFSSSPEDDVGLDPAFIAAQVVKPTSAIIGAFDGTRLVGAAGLNRDRHLKMAHRALVWGVYVTPSARGSGVGAAIIAAVLEHARTWPGLTHLHLSCNERSKGARRLYEKHGFRVWGTEPGALRLGEVFLDEHHMLAPLRGPRAC